MIPSVTRDKPLLQPPEYVVEPTSYPLASIRWAGTRVFAGQPDPADESHFTIAFESEKDGRGIIDGWLKDDDSVVLEVRKKRE